MGSGDVIWHSPQLSSMEHFRYREQDQGHILSGTVVLPRAGIPTTITYEINVNSEWETVGAVVLCSDSDEQRQIEIGVRDGTWWVDGTERTELAGCIDIDLGWTPATNTLPIRRTELEVGAMEEVEAAWLRFPELEFRRAQQTYSRESDSVWTYRAGTFSAELTTGPFGIVVAYGQEIWTTVASRFEA
jgi:hypothetical protein